MDTAGGQPDQDIPPRYPDRGLALGVGSTDSEGEGPLTVGFLQGQSANEPETGIPLDYAGHSSKRLLRDRDRLGSVGLLAPGSAATARLTPSTFRPPRMRCHSRFERVAGSMPRPQVNPAPDSGTDLESLRAALSFSMSPTARDWSELALRKLEEGVARRGPGRPATRQSALRRPNCSTASPCRRGAT